MMLVDYSKLTLGLHMGNKNSDIIAAGNKNVKREFMYNVTLEVVKKWKTII